MKYSHSTIKTDKIWGDREHGAISLSWFVKDKVDPADFMVSNKFKSPNGICPETNISDLDWKDYYTLEVSIALNETLKDRLWI